MGARACALGWFVVAVGCDAGRSKDVSTPPVAAPVAASTKAERSDRPTISGKQRAHDGSALVRGGWSVRRHGFAEPVGGGKLSADGAFRLDVEPGLYTVTIAAVDHAQVWRSVLVARDISVTGTMGTYDRPDPGPTLHVRGQYLDAAGKSIGATPREATRTHAGTYRLELGAVPASAKKIRHQIAITDSRTANAPGATEFEYDGGGDYWAVIDVPSDGAIEIDLGKLPPAGKRSDLKWDGDDPVSRTVQDVHWKWERERSRIFDSMARRDGKILVATDETKAAQARLVAEAKRDVEAAPEGRTRMLLRAFQFSLFPPLDDPAALRDELRWILANVPVDDPLLGITHSFFHGFFRGMETGDAELVASTEAWLDRFVRDHPEPGFAIDGLQILLHQANERGDEARVKELYAILESPRFADTFQRKYIAREYAPDRILRRGNVLPDYDFAALGEPGKRITKAEREGKLYLVEFWATWCGPCVAEMPKLHHTYAAINRAKRGKGRGEKAMRKLRPVDEPAIEFVFVSFDAGEEDVTKFRDAHWSMPWTHAFVGSQGHAATMKQFGFSGVPTAILVDGNGKIVEYGAALRNDKLLPTLQRALADTKTR
jgi:thiol-disulfide isomerase/thioredoxin